VLPSSVKDSSPAKQSLIKFQVPKYTHPPTPRGPKMISLPPPVSYKVSGMAETFCNVNNHLRKTFESRKAYRTDGFNNLLYFEYLCFAQNLNLFTFILTNIKIFECFFYISLQKYLMMFRLKCFQATKFNFHANVGNITNKLSCQCNLCPEDPNSQKTT
jgi:hypothetical protein